MASKHPPSDNHDPDSPQTTLQDYFDDLLGFNSAGDESDDITPTALAPTSVPSATWSSTPSSSATVAPSSEPPVVSPLVPKWQPASEPSSQFKTTIDESTDSAVTAHRARLEKLLASARAQLTEKRAVPNPIVTDYVEPELLPPEIEPELEPDPEPEPEPEPEAVVDDDGIEAFEPEPEHDDYAEIQAEIDRRLAWGSNGRPVWAQERFDVLLFEVGGLTLAVPLISLGQIQPITDELTPLFGQINWFMGLQPTPMGKIRTVNTALFVMPERYDDKLLAAAKYVISIDGLPWGLAVDKVNQPITLNPDDVKWRTERSKRPWLAGTVKAHMCALIDIPAMGQMLQQADVNSRPRK